MSCQLRATTINANWGSGVSFTFNWKNPDGSNANLAGWTAGIIQASTALTTLVSATITTAATGLITCTIDWDTDLVANTEYTFKIQLTHATEQPESTNTITVVYQ